MLKYTRGATYWQLAVIEPIVNKTSRTIEKLNKIFPEITVEGFFELYEKVRINNTHENPKTQIKRRTRTLTRRNFSKIRL